MAHSRNCFANADSLKTHRRPVRLTLLLCVVTVLGKRFDGKLTIDHFALRRPLI